MTDIARFPSSRAREFGRYAFWAFVLAVMCANLTLLRARREDRRPIEISGRARDLKGEPIAEARVVALGSALHFLYDANGTSDDSGQFRLDCYRDPAWILCAAQGYVPVAVASADAAAIRLQAAASLRGEVRDDLGAPQAGVRVQWSETEITVGGLRARIVGVGTSGFRKSGSERPCLSFSWPLAETLTGEAGRFEIPAGTPGGAESILLVGNEDLLKIRVSSTDLASPIVLPRPATLDVIAVDEESDLALPWYLMGVRRIDQRVFPVVARGFREEAAHLVGLPPKVILEIEAPDYADLTITVPRLEPGEHRVVRARMHPAPRP